MAIRALSICTGEGDEAKFLAAVAAKHGKTPLGVEYMAAIEFAKAKFGAMK